MKKGILFILMLAGLLRTGNALSEELAYYIPAETRFDARIPTPEEFLGYPVGSRITEHSRINAYFERLAELSERVELLEIGRTHEQRKIHVLAVSSPGHILNLSQYRDAREKVRQGEDAETPLVIFLGYSVHGNEVSASEAALLSAYYYVAAESEEVLRQLDEAIIFIDPVRNPDGQERFASWVNSNSSVHTYNTSPWDREHSEGWPRGRGNHYWFDLNRDWVNLVHPESKARVALYQDWLPHVQADHHEMGSNTTFFFEPTDPNGAESRFVPQENYALNRLFADYFARALDGIGSFYYTKESYDNKNPNFGSTYPDYNGGVGILFEQGSSRGLRQESDNGVVTFPFTIRNQLVTSLATVDAAIDNREKLLALQRTFFTPTQKGREAEKSYLIGDNHDLSRLHKFVRLLLDHRLEVYENDRDVTLDSVTYEKGKSYLIPAVQPNSALVGIIFDDKADYADDHNLGYGAGFSVAHSSGLSYGVTSSASRGARVLTPPVAVHSTLQQSNYAYLVDFRDSNSQQLLLRLLENDIRVKTAQSPFTIRRGEGEQAFVPGSLLITVANQPVDSSTLHTLLATLGSQEQVEIVPVATGFSLAGVDLGSSSFKRVEAPKVLVVTGGDLSSLEAGEVWHLFDQQLRYPLTRVDADQFRRVPLNSYNRIIFVSGSYSFLEERDREALKSWVESGGTLITLNRATGWAIANGISRAKHVTSKDTVAGGKAPTTGGRSQERVPTSIFQTEIDLTHPLAYGLTVNRLPVILEQTLFIEAGSNAVSTYSQTPLLNGYISPGQLAGMKGSAWLTAERSGSGSVILFAGDPLFRGIWDATSRTFVNAILFGNLSRERE